MASNEASQTNTLSTDMQELLALMKELDSQSGDCKQVEPLRKVRLTNYFELARMILAGQAVVISRAVLKSLIVELEAMSGARYSTAVVIRLHPKEREKVNAAAKAAGLSAQKYVRKMLGLAEKATLEESCQEETPATDPSTEPMK